jgi:hypothetical protein
MGALTTLRAAADPAVRGGDYYAPAGAFTGHPSRAESSVRSHDVDTQRHLWQESERLTDVIYQFSGTNLAIA